MESNSDNFIEKQNSESLRIKIPRDNILDYEIELSDSSSLNSLPDGISYISEEESPNSGRKNLTSHLKHSSPPANLEYSITPSPNEDSIKLQEDLIPPPPYLKEDLTLIPPPKQDLSIIPLFEEKLSPTPEEDLSPTPPPPTPTPPPPLTPNLQPPNLEEDLLSSDENSDENIVPVLNLYSPTLQISQNEVRIDISNVEDIKPKINFLREIGSSILFILVIILVSPVLILIVIMYLFNNYLG
jgi:hypothetical protein